MKTLKFTPELVSKITAGEKTSTQRLFDDKDLKIGDVLSLVNKETGEVFGSATISSLYEKALGDLVEEDWIGHERYASETEMYGLYRQFYGDRVNAQTSVKILSFEFKAK